MSASPQSSFVEMVDGVEILYLTKDLQPATKETAEMAKLVYPDGTVVFAKVVQED